MEFLRPPTDNLYKFLALSGIVLVVVTYLFPRQDSDKLSNIESEILAELRGVQIEYENHVSNFIPFDDLKDRAESTLQVHVLSSNENDRRKVSAFFFAIDDALRREGSVPSRDQLKAFLDRAIDERPELFVKMVPKPEGMPDYTMEEIREIVTADDFQRVVVDELQGVQRRGLETPRELRGRYANLYQEIAAFWIAADANSALHTKANTLMIVGWVLVGIFFPVWYFRVQRYQDKMIRNQAGDSARVSSRTKPSLGAKPAVRRFARS